MNYDDGNATIRNAILKRIDAERGCSVADLRIEDRTDHIAVGVLVIIDDAISELGLIDVRAFFDLPSEFDHAHLLNEIDEIAEACKKARRKAGIGIRYKPDFINYREGLPGTGLRGNWKVN